MAISAIYNYAVNPYRFKLSVFGVIMENRMFNQILNSTGGKLSRIHISERSEEGYSAAVERNGT